MAQRQPGFSVCMIPTCAIKGYFYFDDLDRKFCLSLRRAWQCLVHPSWTESKMAPKDRERARMFKYKGRNAMKENLLLLQHNYCGNGITWILWSTPATLGSQRGMMGNQHFQLCSASWWGNLKKINMYKNKNVTSCKVPACESKHYLFIKKSTNSCWSLR